MRPLTQFGEFGSFVWLFVEPHVLHPPRADVRALVAAHRASFPHKISVASGCSRRHNRSSSAVAGEATPSRRVTGRAMPEAGRGYCAGACLSLRAWASCGGPRSTFTAAGDQPFTRRPRLVYAGRAGTGIKQAELERLWRRLQPLSIGTMPLDVPPPRTSRLSSSVVPPRALLEVSWPALTLSVICFSSRTKLTCPRGQKCLSAAAPSDRPLTARRALT